MIRRIVLLSSAEKNKPPPQKRLSDVLTEGVLLLVNYIKSTIKPFIGVTWPA